MVNAIRSKHYLSGSKGATCKLRIPGVCTGNVETTVPAHIRDRHTGRSIKASDLSVADSCFACHEVFDGRAKIHIDSEHGEYLSREAWLLYALHGLQDTLESRVERGYLTLKQDSDKHARPAKPRKPKSARRPIPAGRKLQSRNDLRKVMEKS